MKITRRKKLIVGTLVAGLLGGGSALAYWTQGGTGSGQAKAGTTSTITVNQTNAAITNLYPGGTAVTLSGNFNNPNSGPVNISGVSAIVHPFDTGTCSDADFAIGGTSGASVVPAGNGVGSWSGLTVRMLDSGANQDGCKNVTIDIDYTAHA